MNLFEKTALEINELKKLKSEDMNDIGSLIKNFLDKKEYLKQLELQTKELKEEIKKLETEVIPDVMLAAGLPSVSTDTGESIKVKDVVQASLPSFTAIDKARGHKKIELLQQREAGLQWFKDNGLSGIIKNEININVGKNESHKNTILNALDSVGVQPSVHETVHAQTLKSVIKECIQSGQDVPTDIFNIYQGKTIEIKKS